MLISEFAAIVITELEYLKMKYTPHLRLRYPVSNFDAGYYKLIDLATQYKDSTLEANSETLMPFINELRVNWENIKGKPTQYNMQPNTPTTQAYIIVAKNLAQALNANPNRYDYLMPHVKLPDERPKCKF